MKYSEKYGVSKASRKYNKSPKRKKHISKPYEHTTHAGERIQADVKVVPRKCIANPEQKLYQYTAIDKYSRIRFLYGYEEQSTYSSADFAKRLVAWYKRHGITVEYIQTDNGFEFTNRFSQSKKDKKILLENTLEQLGIRHKHTSVYPSA